MNMEESCVWVVDDDELFQMITRKNLQKAGIPIKPESYYNGKEAFDTLQERLQSGGRGPCVIILDLNMPLYDGWSFLEAYANLDTMVRNRISVYICSSSIDPADYDRAAANADVKEFLEKPLSLPKIQEILQCHKEWLEQLRSLE